MSRRSARIKAVSGSLEAPKPREAKMEREPDELDIALMNVEKYTKQGGILTSVVADLRKIKKDFKKVCDTTKRTTQQLDQELKKEAGGRTRSKSKPLSFRQEVSSDGKWINKGIDEAKEKFDDDELEYLAKTTSKVKTVNTLKLEQVKYLVIDVFLKELKDIKEGKLESSFHDRYVECSGHSKQDLACDIRTNLFTNQQRDYINGLLQGAFDNTVKNDSGDIKHSDINYVSLVMLAEVTIRIVKYVHKFKSNEQAYEYMSSKSRESLGIEDSD